MYGFFSMGDGSDSSSSSNTLNPGAIAGLVIGAVVILGASITAGWCLYRRFCSGNNRVDPHDPRHTRAESSVNETRLAPHSTRTLASNGSSINETGVETLAPQSIRASLARVGSIAERSNGHQPAPNRPAPAPSHISIVKDPNGKVVSSQVTYINGTTKKLTQSASMKVEYDKADDTAVLSNGNGRVGTHSIYRTGKSARDLLAVVGAADGEAADGELETIILR